MIVCPVRFFLSQKRHHPNLLVNWKCNVLELFEKTFATHDHIVAPRHLCTQIEPTLPPPSLKNQNQPWAL